MISVALSNHEFCNESICILTIITIYITAVLTFTYSAVEFESWFADALVASHSVNTGGVGWVAADVPGQALVDI